MKKKCLKRKYSNSRLVDVRLKILPITLVAWNRLKTEFFIMLISMRIIRLYRLSWRASLTLFLNIIAYDYLIRTNIFRILLYGKKLIFIIFTNHQFFLHFYLLILKIQLYKFCKSTNLSLFTLCNIIKRDTPTYSEE